MKHTMLQGFEWYLKEDANYYKNISKEAKHLKNIGFTRIWMPPAYKGSSGIHDVGYGVYDLYDLGEFDQKGSIPTKYGTVHDYLSCIHEFHKNNIEVIADIVLNHKMGADEKELIHAHEMDWNHRNTPISDDEMIEVWTKYTFPNRKNKYSSFKWNWKCFDGTDYDVTHKKNVLLTFGKKTWENNVSHEDDNFDFIMGDDIDFKNQDVIKELYTWGNWYYNYTKVDGYRLDAVKSIDASFYPGWLKNQYDVMQKDFFVVGEYWSGDINELNNYLNESEYCMTLFDVPLHFHFYDASHSLDTYDMSTILDNTLDIKYSCPFVDNHDTQIGQALESWIDPWFKLHAYSLILLRDYDTPCVFYGDLYGIESKDYMPVKHLEELVWLRNNILGDDIEDMFNDKNCIGWCVHGIHSIIVVMSNGYGNSKTFNVNNNEYIDIVSKEIINVENNTGTFTCKDGGCSIWIEKEVYEQMKATR